MSAGPRSIQVTEDLLVKVMKPYKPGCRYLQSAVVELPGHARAGDPQAVIYGRLSIGESCYIQDTGHFNSVEFNLCYNQLVYALMAQVVIDDLLPAFESWTLDEYLVRQLPDVLIHDFSSKFHRPMTTGDFEGTVEIIDAVERRNFLLVHTRCSFRDEAGGHSHGDVSLAIVSRADDDATSNGDARRSSGAKDASRA